MRMIALGPLALALMSLSGCLNYKYGTSAPYFSHVEPKYDVVMPPNAPAISQQFRPPRTEGEQAQNGTDIAAATGTPILAAAPGRVTISTYEPIYGNRIVIEHGTDPEGRRIQTLYFHMKDRMVTVGQNVQRGQQIGTLGETGLLSSFPHLHFEYHREVAPGARTKSGANWWQGMEQRDSNGAWLDGPGRVTCYTGQTAPVYLMTYPVACR